MNEYDWRLFESMGLCDGRLHFNEAIYEYAVAKMENEDGTKGAHWDLNKIQDLIADHEIDLKENNVLDFAYVMNMLYSDYFGIVKDEEKEWIEFSKKFIFDKDAPEGKALRYWRAMNNAW